MVMDSSHMIKEIVAPGEAVSEHTALAARVVAEVGPVAMAVHAVGFAFVAEEASGGGELLLGAGVDFAAEGFEVGVDELAVEGREGVLAGGSVEGGLGKERWLVSYS